MASPVGHAAVGLSAAVVTARLLRTPVTPLVLAGAFVASGLPDLDFFAKPGGPHTPDSHRHATHSLVSALALAVVLAWPLRATGWISLDVWWCWTAALLTHSLLDAVTTCADDVNKGWGIPLFWPLTRRRFAAVPPWVESGDLRAARSVRDAWRAVRPEMALVAWAGVVGFGAIVFLPR